MGIAPEVQFALDALLGREWKETTESLPNVTEALKQDNEPSKDDIREFEISLRKVFSELEI